MQMHRATEGYCEPLGPAEYAASNAPLFIAPSAYAASAKAVFTVIATMAPPASPHPTAPPRPQPRNPADLFWSFTWLALQGFGGVLAVVQRELVEKKR